MDPLTMMAIAQVGVAATQAVWNFYAGQDALEQKRNRLKQQAELQTAQLDLQAGQVETQFAQGQTDINKAAGSDAAGLAARGIDGAFADLAVTANRFDRTGQLNTQVNQARKGIALQREALATGLSNGMEDIQSQQDQATFDLIGAGLGVGLSAAGAMVKGGVFNAKPSGPASNYLLGDVGLTSPQVDPFDLSGADAGPFALPKRKLFNWG